MTIVPVKHDEGFNQAHATMKMSEYIELLKKGPTNFRIFLYNIMKEVPQLQTDFKYPDLGMKLIKGLAHDVFWRDRFQGVYALRY